MMIACCLAGPAVLGATAAAAVGSSLAVTAVVCVALVVATVIYRWCSSGGGC